VTVVDPRGAAAPARAGAPGQKPLRFHWSLSQAGTPFRRTARTEELSGLLPFDAQLELCRCADECGIDSLLMAIGFTRPDPIVLSAALGRKTERVKFMVACRPGLISPAAFVQQINTLSLVLDGRVHVNMVGGHTPDELHYYGDWLPRAERYRRMDEFLTVCHSFWKSEDGAVDFAGEYYRAGGAPLKTPFSVHGLRRPEIFLGGNSPESAALAVSHADCLWRFAEPPHTLERAIAPVLASGTEVGLLVSLIVRPTHAAAVGAAQDLLDALGEQGREAQLSFERRTDAASFLNTFELARACAGGWASATLWTGAVDLLGAPSIALVGSPEEVAGALLEYKAIGVTQFLFTGWPDVDEMAFFGREVVPLVRALEQERIRGPELSHA
jgi:alkanesulfonate monooxygenase